MSKKFVGFWNVSVILTYIELCIAVGSICAAADGKVWPAVIGLALCGLCDMFDGKIARATKRTKDAEVFGIQIDSLCDLVSFGVLPSAIGHAMGITGVAMAVLMCPRRSAPSSGWGILTSPSRSARRPRARTAPRSRVCRSLGRRSSCRSYLSRPSREREYYAVGDGQRALHRRSSRFIARIRVKKPQI